MVSFLKKKMIFLITFFFGEFMIFLDDCFDDDFIIILKFIKILRII